jgi:replication factor C large subunit
MIFVVPEELAKPPAKQHIQWVEKYRPKTLNQVRGNDKAIATIRAWAKNWEEGMPKKKGLILVGGHGTGKTSAALALASEFNWGVIELNASDARNNENIRKIALAGSMNETFTATGEFVSAHSGGRKLIIIDEADNMFERLPKKYSSPEKAEKDMSDRGGKAAIIETLRKTQQPVILIVNDLYELTKDSGAVINYLSEVVKFLKLRQPTIRLILKQICELEGVEIAPEVLDDLSRHAGGDMRSAINDLQMLAEGNKSIKKEHLKSVGFRNVKGNIFEALRVILHTTQADEARKSLWDLNESPEDIILWLDENLPLEYKRPEDLFKGYMTLSKADVFLGRIRRRQYYGLWAYAKDLMTAGVALAKREGYRGWVKYQFPSWLSKMSRTKMVRKLQKSTALKIGRYTHTSKNEVLSEILPSFRHVFKSNHRFAVNMSIRLEFTKEELGWLIDEKLTSNKIKYLLTEIKNTQERLEKMHAQASSKGKGKGKDVESGKVIDVFPHDSNGNVVVPIESESEIITKKEPEPEPDVEEDHEDSEKKDDKEKEKKVQKNLFDY